MSQMTKLTNEEMTEVQMILLTSVDAKNLDEFKTQIRNTVR